MTHQAFAQGLECARLSVHQGYAFDGAGLANSLRIVQEVSAICVRTEAVHHDDFRGAIALDAKDPHPWASLDQSAAQGVLGLKADDDDGVFGVLDTRFEMVKHATGFAHPARAITTHGSACRSIA
jgi:hypothetical protein